jgi:hypothetical protein
MRFGRTNYGSSGAILSLLIAATTWLSAAASATDLADLATVVDRTSHRASSFDRTGGNADNVQSLEPGRTVVLLDVDGPGVLTHVWMTVSAFEGHSTLLRDLVLRVYWEGSAVPSVEVPLGDFFGLGHGRAYPVQSAPINVGADPRALNCYWPMPFHKHARIEVTNRGERNIRRLYYNVDYELGPIPPRQGLFHAEFRQVKNLQPQLIEGNTTGKDNYVILDTKGEGQYVGCFLFVDSAPGGWWGEGDDMIFIDGENEPSIVGTGTEDYFCEAWGFDRVTGFPFYGLPLLDKLPDGWMQTSVYRFHIPDPVRFKKSIRVTIEHGWPGKVTNDYSSVAYWYQLKPVAAREPLPEPADCQPRKHETATTGRPASFSWCATRAEPQLRRAGIAARAVTTGYREARGGGYLRIDAPNRPVRIEVPVPGQGLYQVRAILLPVDRGSAVTIGLENQSPRTATQIDAKGTTVDLGTVQVGRDQNMVVTVQSAGPVGIDEVLVKVAKTEQPAR